MKYLQEQLLPHQKRIVDMNPDKILLDWECRTGKTLPACHWIDHPKQAGNTYIICKKANKAAWQSMGTKATVLTKEEFKRDVASIKHPTAIVVDEVHWFGAALFVKGRSALATSLYNLLRQYPDCKVMGLSGSPVRNSPWSLHSLLCYVGVYIDWKAWRERFFILEKKPYMRFPGYIPKKDWREGVDKVRSKYCDQVSLSEVVHLLPPIKSRVITIKQPKYVQPTDEIVTWTHEHKHEQKNKYKEIIDLEYRKVIVVAYYLEQIQELAKELEKEKPVFILTGATKDQGAVIKAAQEAPDCYFIVQAGIGEGWDGWMFGCMVFASMPHSYVANVQMHARQRNLKHLKDIEIIYLVGGRWDKKILQAYNEGEDFNPHKQ